MNHTGAAGHLTDSDRNQINKIFAAQDTPREVMLEDALNIWIAARLRSIPKDLADDLSLKWRALFGSIKKNDINGAAFGDGISYFFMGLSDGAYPISVYTPRELFKGVTYYATLVHEFEHALQIGMLLRSVFKEKGVSEKLWKVEVDHAEKLLQKFANRIEVMSDSTFLQEKGAMQSEWDFLHALPEGLRDQTAKQVAAMKELPEEVREVAIRSLKNSNLSLDDYLNFEWKAGRYSKWAIFFHEGEVPSTVKKRAVLGAVATLAITAVVVAVRQLCMDAEHGTPVSGGVPKPFLGSKCLRFVVSQPQN